MEVQYTAIVLSQAPVALELEGVTVLNRVQDIHKASDLQQARYDALAKVGTPWAFFLDTDDCLPDDYLSVLNECAARGMPLAYTNELVKGVVNRPGMYDRNRHARAPLFIHYLVLFRADAARRAIKVIPRGEYLPEQMLYFELAKKGAAWVDRVGYEWIPGKMHRTAWSCAAQFRSIMWCMANKD